MPGDFGRPAGADAGDDGEAAAASGVLRSKISPDYSLDDGRQGAAFARSSIALRPIARGGL